MGHKDSSRNSSLKDVRTVDQLVKYVQEERPQMIDACFTDALGAWHHLTLAPSQVKSIEQLITGFAFDGSSIPLMCKIECSDVTMVPDPRTCWIDPFLDEKVLHVACMVKDPFGNDFSGCPRTIARKAEAYMRSTQIADTMYVGPEAEFFIFGDAKFEVSTMRVRFEVEPRDLDDGTVKGTGTSGSYLAALPSDSLMELRNEMMLTLEDIGIETERHHHEVATGQHELGIRYQSMEGSADAVMSLKYIVKNIAKKHNKCATFMPKPMYGENGSGMHCHQSLWKNNKNLFYDQDGRYEQLSELALHYIAGLLKHAGAVLAFTNSTVNSYKRLVAGYEAPVSLAYSKGNRSAAIRIPVTPTNCVSAKRIEFRCPDSGGCPYLGFAAMLMAGLDGIIKKLEPPASIDCNLYSVKSDELIKTPASLDDALLCLENDHEFLLKGDVFTKDFIEAYIDLKRKEFRACTVVPHPKEYELYFNC